MKTMNLHIGVVKDEPQIWQRHYFLLFHHKAFELICDPAMLALKNSVKQPATKSLNNNLS